MIIAGDVGGTKAVIALYERTTSGLRQVSERTYPSANYDSLEAVLSEFLRDHPGVELENGCFGIPGVVIEGRTHPTNLSWDVVESSLERVLRCHVKLLNDLQTTAYGVRYLGRDEIVVLHPGVSPKPRANIAVIAAGTGLGEAILAWDGTRHHPMATEGGHAGFAPTNDREIELLRYLQKQFGNHVSNERVCSGPGFHNIYCFLRDTGFAPEPDWLKQKLASGDPSAEIAEIGLAGRDKLCEATLSMFVSIYGSEAGNLALRSLALAGVFVAGGIAPKLIKVLQNGLFMKAFTDKGRFNEMLERIEVTVALNPHASLIGAAHFALSMSM